MKNYYNIILSLTIISLMSVGWGQVFYDNFDNGIWDDVWTLLSPDNYDIEFDNGANGSPLSLNLSGTSEHEQGLRTDFQASQPEYISFYVKPDLTDRLFAESYFKVNSSNYPSNGEHFGIYFLLYDNVCDFNTFMISSGTGGSHCYGYPVVEEFYHIEFKNINFNSYTFDWYVNNELVQSSIGFRNNIDSFTTIHLYNWEASSGNGTWYDEIYVGNVPNFPDWVYGCTYPEALNYNSLATHDDGSCEYLWGDMNHDGTLNVLDIVTLANNVLSGLFP